MTTRVVILSAPSGGGKTTIAQGLAARRADVGLSVSATTRAPRPGERDGAAYHFVSRAEFQRRVAAGEFLEWAEYAGELYGTLRAEVEALRRAGRHVILDIDVQGARQVWARLPRSEIISVFVLPPSPAAWQARLRDRRTEAAAELARRLAVAGAELAAAPEYEHMVVNETLDRTVAEVSAILDADGQPPRRPADWRQRLTGLQRAAAQRSGEQQA